MTQKLQSSRNEILVGTFFLLGIVLIVVYLFLMKSPARPFGSVEFVRINVEFDKDTPIKEGATIKIGGFPCGLVGIPEKAGNTNKLITAVIRKDCCHILKEDCSAKIESAGLVGDFYLSLNPGTSNKPLDSTTSKIKGYF